MADKKIIVIKWFYIKSDLKCRQWTHKENYDGHFESDEKATGHKHQQQKVLSSKVAWLKEIGYDCAYNYKTTTVEDALKE